MLRSTTCGAGPLPCTGVLNADSRNYAVLHEGRFCV
jgi:hypothetical protein